MKILHVSDTHGPIPFAKLPDDFDVLCHTGDWFPEPGARSRAEIAPYQMEFLRYEGAALTAFLKGRPFVGCLGNHDLLSEAYVEKELQALGLDATLPGGHMNPRKTVGRSSISSGQTFLGMREVPWINGAFEGECDHDALFAATYKREARWYSHDVLLAHCPPQSTLSGPSAYRWGNGHLASSLKTNFGELAPKLVLCGHIHECFGSETIGASLVVNSACGWTLVDTDGPSVLRIGGRGR